MSETPPGLPRCQVQPCLGLSQAAYSAAGQGPAIIFICADDAAQVSASAMTLVTAMPTLSGSKTFTFSQVRRSCNSASAMSIGARRSSMLCQCIGWIKSNIASALDNLVPCLCRTLRSRSLDPRLHLDRIRVCAALQRHASPQADEPTKHTQLDAQSRTRSHGGVLCLTCTWFLILASSMPQPANSVVQFVIPKGKPTKLTRAPTDDASVYAGANQQDNYGGSASLNVALSPSASQSSTSASFIKFAVIGVAAGKVRIKPEPELDPRLETSAARGATRPASGRPVLLERQGACEDHRSR